MARRADRRMLQLGPTPGPVQTPRRFRTPSASRTWSATPQTTPPWRPARLRCCCGSPLLPRRRDHSQPQRVRRVAPQPHPGRPEPPQRVATTLTYGCCRERAANLPRHRAAARLRRRQRPLGLRQAPCPRPPPRSQVGANAPPGGADEELNSGDDGAEHSQRSPDHLLRGSCQAPVGRGER